MSFKRVGTASDLVRFGCSLKIECIACGAARTMTGLEVAKVHGRASLEHLRARLKCRRCRLKVAKMTVLPPV
ncbi:MAG: hypothetical protein HOP91_00535 [Sphingomonas sp.]|nr:hypothetical protein [Sphingomonas sp.]